MEYFVLKYFNDVTGPKMPGDTVEADLNRAAKLRKQGLIGGLATRETKIETSTIPVPENAALPKATNKKVKS